MRDVVLERSRVPAPHVDACHESLHGRVTSRFVRWRPNGGRDGAPGEADPPHAMWIWEHRPGFANTRAAAARALGPVGAPVQRGTVPVPVARPDRGRLVPELERRPRVRQSRNARDVARELVPRSPPLAHNPVLSAMSAGCGPLSFRSCAASGRRSTTPSPDLAREITTQCVLRRSGVFPCAPYGATKTPFRV
jgi:hypothetical protein